MPFIPANELSKANATLSLVQLCLRGERVYVRGRKFPPKPGQSSGKQYEISLGFKLNSRTIKTALAKAHRIDSDLMLGNFDWANWLVTAKKPQLVGDWLPKFEENYWSTREQTPERQNTWKKNYLSFLRHLPVSEELTLELLITMAKRHKPQTRQRQACCNAYGALAEFAGFDRAKVRSLGRGYKQKPKEDPWTDDEIKQKLIDCTVRQWQWVGGMAATFGLRNHEIPSCNIDQIREGIVETHENTKTGRRIAVACPFEWVDLFELWDKPKLTISLEGCNNQVGGRVGAGLKRNKLPRCYDLRDCYGLRLRKNEQLPGLRARWMGHSIEVHEKHYMDRTIDEHLIDAYKKFRDQ